MSGAFFFRQKLNERRIQIIFSCLGKQFRRCSGIKNLAVIHGNEPVKTLRFIHIRSRNNHAHIRLFQLDIVYKIPELTARQRVNSGSRFIKHQQIRIVDQRTAQSQLLFHPPGKFSSGTVQEGVQPRALCQPVDPSAPFRRIVTEKHPEKLQIFFHSEGKIEVFPQSLGHISDFRTNSLPGFGIPHISAEHLKRTLLHGMSSGDQRKKRGFPHSVRTDQSNDFPGWNIQ